MFFSPFYFLPSPLYCEAIGAGRDRTLACQIKSLLCCLYTTTPEPIRGRRFNRRAVIVLFSSLLCPLSCSIAAAMTRGGVEPPLPPYQSDMLPLQHRAAIGVARIELRCLVLPTHASHHYPSPRKSERPDSNRRSPGPPARRISKLSHVLNHN